MAKQLLRTYIFTPGAAGSGTLKIPGKWDLSQFLIITNSTRNQFLYNFADPTYSGTTVTFNRANDTNFTQALQNSDGITTLNIAVDTSAYSATDVIQIFVERAEMITRPWPMGTDAFERQRMAAPQSMLDADFEYGLQPTKWQQITLVRGYPSIYEIPGSDYSVVNVTTDASGGGSADTESLITVTMSVPHYLTVGTPITVKGLLSTVLGFSRAEGSFVINSVPNPTQLTYYCKSKVGNNNGDTLYTTYTQVRKGGFFTGAGIGSPTFSVAGSGAAATGTVTVSFQYAHGLIPGDPILVTVSSDNGANNHVLCQGPFYITTVTNATTLIYNARAVGTITGTPLGTVYSRPDSFFVHRPIDGGVSLGTGGPSHGIQTIRQSKKYIRYQSGKAINYNTAALFAPNYDIRIMTATNTVIGSTVYVTTDDVDHGLQANAVVQVSGINTNGYNGNFTVASIIDERTFTFINTATLGATTASLATPALVSLVSWHGATVRAGTYDDQNGIYWQYDGQQMAVGYRTSTRQVAGMSTVVPDLNLITGLNSRYNEQFAAGDRTVIRGMTHVISGVTSATWATVTPDYRGSSTSTNVKIAKVIDFLIPQSQWNIDRCDGSGGVFNPSGYNLLPNRLQMIALQWTWYGAGFIEYLLRGSDGNYIPVHRIKNSNVNTEAYMRSGNMPVRYEVINESARSQLQANLSAVATAMTLTDVTYFPTTGTVYIDSELVGFTGKNSSTLQLTGLTRATTMTFFAAGALRNVFGGPAAAHSSGTGVILVSQTASPIISHWGSAYIQDGGFDTDRGYIFNYQATNVGLTTEKTTAFAIRLAPSVSNAVVGDLGTRDLINRAQLLLQGIEITAGGGGTNQAIIIEGVLNPSNYPTTTTNITWNALTSQSAGGQPSFSQIADGRSVRFDDARSTVTSLAVPLTPNTTTVWVAGTSTIQIGDAISTSSGQIAGGTLVTGYAGNNSFTMSKPAAGPIPTPGAVKFASGNYALPGETIFSFISSPATKDALDLSALKELTNTPLGGRGTFPNGPDVLMINAYITSGTGITANLVLRWGEAQA